MDSPSSPVGARRTLLPYLRPHRRTLGVLVVALLVSSALPLYAPQLLRRFIDEAAAGRPLGALVAIAGRYLAVAVAGQAVGLGALYLASRMTWVASNRLREDLVEHVLRLDLAFHGRHTAGSLIERVDGDVAALAQLVGRFLFQVMGSLLLLVGTVVLVLREDLRVGGALVAFVVVAAVVVVRAQQLALPAATADREAQAQLIGGIEERLTAAEEIRALAAADHAMRHVDETHRVAYAADLRWQVRSGAVVLAVNLLFVGGTALMLTLGIVLLRRGALSVGTVVLLFQYTVMVRRPLEQMIHQFKELQKAAAGAARVVELLALRPTITEPAAERAVALPDTGPLDVRFEGVTFSYGDETPVLHDVDLHVAAGRSIGLVGRTGSGKTTVARLLLRLYDVEDGRGAVLLDGADVRLVTSESLRRRVRIVTQDVQLFAASLRDNLTVFDDAAPVDDETMVGVLRDVGLGAWLDALPGGLDTELAPGGGGLSAGEAQLLAFARVFLADPGLVVLDEASSRLDPATEALIDAAVDRLLAGRTAVVIAHRLSSLERVDDIAVIDRGRVVEHGPRAALAADPDSRFGRLLEAATVGSRR